MTRRGPPGSARAPTLAFAIALVALGCSHSTPSAYQLKVAEAARANTAGRPADAAHAYDEAAKADARPRDREYAAYLAALANLRAGDERAALARLDAIATADGEYAAQAAFHAVEVREHGADATTTRAAYLAIARRFPTHGVGKVSLLRVIHGAKREDSADTIVATTAELATIFKDTELAETVAYEHAKALRDAGAAHAAERAFLDVATRWPYPRGAYFDDSLYFASELAEGRGDAKAALGSLERLLTERETSHTMGTYQRPRMSAALLRQAEIYERMGEKDSAIRSYERLHREFTTSLLRDDALYRAATLYRALGRNKDACSRLATLVDEFPDSRFVPCAEAECPVARGKKSRAPTICRGTERR